MRAARLQDALEQILIGVLVVCDAAGGSLCDEQPPAIFRLKSGKQMANTLFLNGVEIGVSAL
jgi:hypothetical protein